jgi:hypothetical protein
MRKRHIWQKRYYRNDRKHESVYMLGFGVLAAIPVFARFDGQLVTDLLAYFSKDSVRIL